MTRREAQNKAEKRTRQEGPERRSGKTQKNTEKHTLMEREVQRQRQRQRRLGDGVTHDNREEARRGSRGERKGPPRPEPAEAFKVSGPGDLLMGPRKVRPSRQEWPTGRGSSQSAPPHEGPRPPGPGSGRAGRKARGPTGGWGQGLLHPPPWPQEPRHSAPWPPPGRRAPAPS